MSRDLSDPACCFQDSGKGWMPGVANRQRRCRRQSHAWRQRSMRASFVERSGNKRKRTVIPGVRLHNFVVNAHRCMHDAACKQRTLTSWQHLPWRAGWVHTDAMHAPAGRLASHASASREMPRSWKSCMEAGAAACFHQESVQALYSLM